MSDITRMKGFDWATGATMYQRLGAGRARREPGEPWMLSPSAGLVLELTFVEKPRAFAGPARGVDRAP